MVYKCGEMLASCNSMSVGALQHSGCIEQSGLLLGSTLSHAEMQTGSRSVLFNGCFS